MPGPVLNLGTHSRGHMKTTLKPPVLVSVSLRRGGGIAEAQTSRQSPRPGLRAGFQEAGSASPGSRGATRLTYNTAREPRDLRRPCSLWSPIVLTWPLKGIIYRH